MAFNAVAANTERHIHKVLTAPKLVEGQGKVGLELVPLETVVLGSLLHPVIKAKSDWSVLYCTVLYCTVLSCIFLELAVIDVRLIINKGYKLYYKNFRIIIKYLNI